MYGWAGEIVLAKSELLPEALREDAFDLRQDYVVDSTRIRRELGYREIVSEDEGLRRTIDWERLNPPEPGSQPEPDYDAEDRALADVWRGRHWCLSGTKATL